MKRFLLTIAIALIGVLSGPALAGGLDSNAAHAAGFSKLTEAEKAEILQQIATKAQANSTAGTLTTVAEAVKPEKVDQWLNIGERIGKMIGGAAKEVGVAVNDFVKTPVGLTAMGLIVWHYMGAALVHIFGGVFLMFVMLASIWLVARKRVDVEYQYDPEKTDLLGRSRLVSVKKGRLSDDDTVWILLGVVVTVIVTLFTVFTF
jgi:uncharacterized membrane protein